MFRHVHRRPLLRAGLLPLAAMTLVVATAASAAATSGPDIASYQHPGGASINWTAVRNDGQRFVFVKATEGTGYRNPYFAGDWSGSRSAGLFHGAYHFARPSGRSGSAAAQARYFVATAGKAGRAGDLPPTLDLEVSGGLGPTKLIAWTKQWVTTVHNLTRRRPMIYSYPYFWAHNMRGTRLFRDYRLWGASYGSRPTTFAGAWTHWTFWQYSSTSRISGIKAQVDMNRFNGTLTQLRRLAHIGTSTTTASGSTSTTSSSGSGTTSTSSGSTSTTSTRATTRVTLRVPDSAQAWQDFTISGRLMRGTHPVAGKAILVRGRLVGYDSWIDVAHLTTDDNGRYRMTGRAPSSAQLQAVFAGTSRLRPDSSAIKTVSITQSSYFGYSGHHH